MHFPAMDIVLGLFKSVYQIIFNSLVLKGCFFSSDRYGFQNFFELFTKLTYIIVFMVAVLTKFLFFGAKTICSAVVGNLGSFCYMYLENNVSSLPPHNLGKNLLSHL